MSYLSPSHHLMPSAELAWQLAHFRHQLLHRESLDYNVCSPLDFKSFGNGNVLGAPSCTNLHHDIQLLLDQPYLLMYDSPSGANIEPDSRDL
jgi:hypothetical protein